MARTHSGWLFAITCAAGLICSPDVAISQVIQGILVDDRDDVPIEAATVVLLAEDSLAIDTAATDTAGFFRVSAENGGQYRLIARRIGYPATISNPLRISPGDTLRVEFRIAAGAVLLDPVLVTGRRRAPPPDIRDFYARADQAIFGTFITREEIERANVIRASDLLRRIPGMQVGPLQWGSATATMRGCTPTIIIDGVAANFERSIDNLVTPMDLEGIEVYRASSQVPVQYGGMRIRCGAIMLWTRRGF